MIHRVACGSLERVNPARFLPAYWQIGEKGKVVSFTLVFHHAPDILTRLTHIFYEMGINIIDLSVSDEQNGAFRISICIEIPAHDLSFLDRLLQRIRLNIPEYLFRNDDLFDKKK